MSRPLAIVVLLALGLSVSLSACGVKGGLDTPSQAQQTVPPATAQADSGQGKKAGEAPKPHQSTFLDWLL